MRGLSEENVVDDEDFEDFRMLPLARSTGECTLDTGQAWGETSTFFGHEHARKKEHVVC